MQKFFPTASLVLLMLSLPLCAQSYGSPASTQTVCATDEYISNVTLTDANALTLLNNNSVCGGIPAYEDFTTSVSAATLAPGSTYNISVTVGNWWAGDVIHVWLDLNHNFSFEDAGELVLTVLNPANSAPSLTVAGVFVVPTMGGLGMFGPTRLRVRLLDTYNSAPVPLSNGNSVYGNCEDYAVNLLGMSPEYQVNGPTAVLSFDGLLATPYMGAASPAVPGSTMVGCANAFGFMADVFANYLPIVPAGGGGLSVGPHIVNLDVLNGDWVRVWDAWVPLGPSFGTCGIMFPVPWGVVSAQMVVLDPTSFMGVALSQACQINTLIIN